MILFKSEVEKFNDAMSKGFSDRSKGNFSGAVRNFLQAYEIASKSRDPDLMSKANLALFYALFYDALVKGGPDSFKRAAEQCRKLDASTELDLGLASKVFPLDLMRELEILAEISSLPSFDVSKIESMDLSVADRYESVGNLLLAEGSKRLILEDLVGLHETLNVMGFRLLGYSRIIRAVKMEENEPGSAIELYSEALAFLQQATPEVRDFVASRLAKLGKTTRCWVCHREIQGEDVNYIYLPASVNKYIKTRYERDAPYLIDEKRIAVCRVCYTMVYGLSDKISKYYYDLAIKEMRQMEERINARLRELQVRVDLLRTTTMRFERK